MRGLALIVAVGGILLSVVGSGSGAPRRALLVVPQEAVWSADGKWVAVPVRTSLDQGDVLVVNLRTRRTRTIPVAVDLPQWVFGGDRPISWSPTERAFVVTSSRGLFLVRVGGPVRRLAYQGRFGGWSPDGRRMVFTIGPKGGTTTIALADRKGVVLKRVRDDGEAGPWSPNGKEIAVIGRGTSGVPRVHLMRPDGSHYRQLTSETRVYEGRERVRPPQAKPVWSPDGKWLAFTEEWEVSIPVDPPLEASETLVFRIGTTTEPVRLGRGEPLWSRGSKKIAVASCCTASDVTLMSPDGRGPRHRFTLADRFAVEWSPDGRWFIVQEWDWEAPVINRLGRDGRMEHLTMGKLPDISPRGDWIVFTRGGALGSCEGVYAERLATRRVVPLTGCQ